MKTIEGVVRNGEILPREPLVLERQSRCLITIFDEDLEELHRLSQAELEEERQERLSDLLEVNKQALLSTEQERELDQILTDVYQLAAKRARATRILEHL